MALPKYKTSRANTHSRRANWKAKAAQTVTCPNCGAPFSDSHPIEPLGASSWNPNQG